MHETLPTRHEVKGLFEELERQERTAAWLARKTMYTPGYVAHVRVGRKNPSPRFMDACARVLGVPATTLFDASLFRVGNKACMTGTIGV